MVQVVVICSHGGQWPIYSVQSILWVLVVWWYRKPGYQQSWPSYRRILWFLQQKEWSMHGWYCQPGTYLMPQYGQWHQRWLSDGIMLIYFIHYGGKIFPIYQIAWLHDTMILTYLCRNSITNSWWFFFKVLTMNLPYLNHEPGGRLNKKDGLTRYGNSHVKDKTS